MRSHVFHKAFLITWVFGIFLSFAAWAQERKALTEEKDFTSIRAEFKERYTSLNKANEAFTLAVQPHVRRLESFRNWMEYTTKLLSKDDHPTKDSDIDKAFRQYRDLLKSDETCVSASLMTLQNELQETLRTLKVSLEDLKAMSASPKKTVGDLEKKSMKKDLKEAEDAYRKAEEVISSYSTSLLGSNICSTFTSYDLVLVAAETIAASRSFPDSLRLSDYLTNEVSSKSPAMIKKDALIYLKAIEASMSKNLKEGHITKSIILFNRLDGNIAFGLAASKRLPQKDIDDIEEAKTELKSRLKLIAESFNFPSVDGLQNMVAQKAQDTFAQLTALERAGPRATAAKDFEAFKRACQKELSMSPSQPYRFSAPRNIEEIMDLEVKLEDAQIQMRGYVNPERKYPSQIEEE